VNYNEQRAFLKEYRMASIAFTAAVIVVEIIQYLIGSHTPGPRQIAVNALLTTALLYAIVYLPKYLHLTIETHKKFFWNVRIRWILIAILLVCGLFLADRSAQYKELIMGTGLLLVANTAVHFWIKRNRGELASSSWIGSLYAVVDGLGLYLIFEAINLDLVSKTLICGLAAHLALQLNASLLAIGVLGSINSEAAPDLVMFLMLAGASYGLTLMAARRNEQNVEETVNELAEFTDQSREEVERLLSTSTGKLAADWHKKQPQSREAVETWYQDNSQFYIYDLAQYHLAYKHIVFTLDVMSLARGRVLDYGAGIGDLSLALAERGCDVTYFDVEGRSKQYARWQARQRNMAGSAA
jgi:hypothetical protein